MNRIIKCNHQGGSTSFFLRTDLALKVILGVALLTFSLGQGAWAGVRAFPIPTPDSEPISIILGPDGNLWFTEQNASNVARVTPDGVITEFRTPTFSFPLDIAAGPDGNVWFSEGAVGQIAFITPSGRIREIFFSSSGTAGGIVTGSDGNIWFTDLTGNSIWRLELATRSLTSFPVPTVDSFPSDITLGADGNLWFVEGVGGKIGRITPEGVITEFGSDLSLPFSIATGPDGNVWFTQRFKPEIGKITPAGEFTFYPTPGNPEEIAPGHGNTLIFSEFGSSKIATITTDGVVTESPEIRGSLPTGIAAGPDSRSIWFLGYGNDKVYRAVFPR
jgi:streptogramin lyase